VQSADTVNAYPTTSQDRSHEAGRRGARGKVFTKTTDANGMITISNTEMGMSSFLGAIASVYFSPSVGLAILATARLTSTTSLSVIVFKSGGPANPLVITAMVSASVTVYVLAW
jgi:hypothetical protein